MQIRSEGDRLRVERPDRESRPTSSGTNPKSAEAFFSKTYVTGGMKTLLRQGLQRLSGTSGQAVFELKQAMGGGKTHSMLALGYLAANPKLFGLVAKDITQGIEAGPAPRSLRSPAVRSRAISTCGATSLRS